MIIRWYYQQAGGHVYVRVFTGTAKNMTFGKCGSLTFDAQEWPAICNQLQSAVELIPEEAPVAGPPEAGARPGVWHEDE